MKDYSSLKRAGNVPMRGGLQNAREAVYRCLKCGKEFRIEVQSPDRYDRHDEMALAVHRPGGDGCSP